MTNKTLPADAFSYDPDYRSKVHPRDPKKPYCCRCQQNLNVEKAIAIAVTINEETFMAVKGHDRHEEIRTNFNPPQVTNLVSNGYMGKDCYEIVTGGTTRLSKRKVRKNIYGNWVGYVSGRRAEEFGPDDVMAGYWLLTGERDSTTGYEDPTVYRAAAHGGTL